MWSKCSNAVLYGLVAIGVAGVAFLVVWLVLFLYELVTASPYAPTSTQPIASNTTVTPQSVLDSLLGSLTSYGEVKTWVLVGLIGVIAITLGILVALPVWRCVRCWQGRRTAPTKPPAESEAPLLSPPSPSGMEHVDAIPAQDQQLVATSTDTAQALSITATSSSVAQPNTSLASAPRLPGEWPPGKSSVLSPQNVNQPSKKGSGVYDHCGI